MKSLADYQNVALVLSGGGANGAFQVSAEKYLREEVGLSWSIISGQSVGALNGAMLSIGKTEELHEMWQTMSAGDVLRKPGLWTALRILFRGRLGLLSNAPLLELLHAHFEATHPAIPLRYGAVDLLSGEYRRFTEADLSPETLLASASLPIAWPPRLSGNDLLVDGGLRNNGPIGEVIAAQPDLVVIINCKSQTLRPIDAPRNLLQKGKRVLEILLNESIVSDYHEYLMVNRLVAQTRTPLLSPSGRQYKHFDTLAIEPDVPLSFALDFSREAIRHRQLTGRRCAQRAAGRFVSTYL